MSTYQVKEGQVSSIEVIGYRQKDGMIKIGDELTGDCLPDFPKEIETPYGVFTLEVIKKNDEDSTLPDDHGGKHIQWGIYI